jgi:hypothetical protein
MKKIIKLNESDVERLVKKIIREEGEDENSFNIKDVDNWMNSFKQYFLNKQAGKSVTKRINTVPEKAGLAAAFMDFLGVDTAQISKAKQILSKKRQQGNQEQGGQEGGDEGGDENFDV